MLGRTNRVFPKTWLKLVCPARSEEIGLLVQQALASGSPIDLSTNPALWGGHLRGCDSVLCCSSTTAFELATETAHAVDLIQAHLIEVLSCIGREHLDFYFLRIRRLVEPFQLAGALEALEWARQEGHVRYLGLHCDGNPNAVLAQWTLNDAFEVLLASPENLVILDSLARQRRVGRICIGPGEADAQLIDFGSVAP